MEGDGKIVARPLREPSYHRAMAPLTIKTEVQSEGLVQVRLPDVPAGRRVKVTVEEMPDAPKERVFGLLKGRVEIMPGFDDPIPGFA